MNALLEIGGEREFGADEEQRLVRAYMSPEGRKAYRWVSDMFGELPAPLGDEQIPTTPESSRGDTSVHSDMLHSPPQTQARPTTPKIVTCSVPVHTVLEIPETPKSPPKIERVFTFNKHSLKRLAKVGRGKH